MRELIHISETFSNGIDVKMLNMGSFDSRAGCYSPSDVCEANRQLKANCGPASFAAICRLPVLQAMRFFPHFPQRDWTTKGDMRKALKSLGVEFRECRENPPAFGVALLQFRVDDRPLHPLFSLGMTHWVGVWHNSFYDINWGGWLPISVWREIVLPRFRYGNRGVYRWGIRDSFEVIDESCWID
ncbi:MAG: hypothetical protein JWM68_3493 [Verrucomicrobiales bacterium]|nr:hypothetical protein [Verrucomicrobiales bacterium]